MILQGTDTRFSTKVRDSSWPQLTTSYSRTTFKKSGPFFPCEFSLFENAEYAIHNSKFLFQNKTFSKTTTMKFCSKEVHRKFSAGGRLLSWEIKVHLVPVGILTHLDSQKRLLKSPYLGIQILISFFNATCSFIWARLPKKHQFFLSVRILTGRNCRKCN